MSEADELFKAKTEDVIPRDQWGRPQIKQPDGSMESYTRVSTLAKALDDTHNLTLWAKRMVARGVAISPDLIAVFASMTDPNRDRDTKKQADEYAEQAMERAKSSTKRVMGTAIHSFTEQYDRGQTIEHVPAEVVPDLRSYVAATKDVTWLAFEEFVVIDRIKAAGTMDRLGRRGNAAPRAVDLKTGSVGDYNALSFACQLAMYAAGKKYDPATGARIEHGEVIDQEVGEIIHVAQGEGKTTIYEVDLEVGRRAVMTALSVRDLRKTKGIMVERKAPTISVMQQLSACTTIEELRAVWEATKDSWTDKERKFSEHMAADLRARSQT